MNCVLCGDEEGNLVRGEAGISQFCHLFLSGENTLKNERTVYRKEDLHMVSLQQKIYGLSIVMYATTFFLFNVPASFELYYLSNLFDG